LEYSQPFFKLFILIFITITTINVTNAIATALSMTGAVNARSSGVADGDVKGEGDKEGVAWEGVAEGVGGLDGFDVVVGVGEGVGKGEGDDGATKFAGTINGS
jgi:hypothetical protein